MGVMATLPHMSCKAARHPALLQRHTAHTWATDLPTTLLERIQAK